MSRFFLMIVILSAGVQALAQKKPLDHSVYDGWQSIGERNISNDGKFAVYAVNPQEGDGTLYVQSTGTGYKKAIPRGYNATITEDSRYVIFRIRPYFKDVREAKIKKKKPEDMPKDSLGILLLGTDSLVTIARVKSYSTPQKASGWLAYQLEKALPEPAKTKTQPDSLTQINNLVKMVDSLKKVADSLTAKVNEAKMKGLSVLQPASEEKKSAKKSEDPAEEGTELVLRDLNSGKERKFRLVSEYVFSKTGNVMVVETTKKNNDSLSKAAIVWIAPGGGITDTIFRKFNDAKGFTLDEEGTQLAFVAERDSATKALRKFYKLYYYSRGMDSAALRADRNTKGIAQGLTVNEFANIRFSKNGDKLFFQVAPIRPIKDTSLVDFETARLDIWHYNDDYLQPQQLKQLDQELKRGYMAVILKGSDKIVQLGSADAEDISVLNEGNSEYVLAESDKNNRIAQQWQGFALESAYLVSTIDGSKKPIATNLRAFFNGSPGGNYISWYDWRKRQYFTYKVSTGKTTVISSKIKYPVWDEEDDHPDDPPNHGIMGWEENDKYVFIYDKYDVWKVDPDGIEDPVAITSGRKKGITFRYWPLDREERFIKEGQGLLFLAFDNKTKENGLAYMELGKPMREPSVYPSAQTGFVKAKSANVLLYNVQSPNSSNVAVVDFDANLSKNVGAANVLSNTNPQQSNYNWFTVDMIKWKMFDGKMSEGLVFKPENFDSTKKYPVIFYFYEKNVDSRYFYRSPAPSASTVNIPYFTSNGYIVVDPNIYYKNGQPGESAYNSVVSAAKYMSHFKWVDSTKMAIQGQSWGGYQVAYLITRTNIFAAAGAGAPVANMTSAYGGIRWGPGINRQFQYERSQSRIGATLWEKPELYIKNSPLFAANKITTPVLIMHNDADGAVPWYQGIEFFTALRRLGKKAWLLEYNGEDHNLVERRNRKDLSIRLAQFFDYYLKGAKPAPWIVSGVPATLKGIDWGTTIEEEPKKTN